MGRECQVDLRPSQPVPLPILLLNTAQPYSGESVT
jgi:hypothetical protein